MPDTRRIIWPAVALVVAGSFALAPLASQETSTRHAQTLDIHMGEFLSETLARSDYPLSNLTLRSDSYTHILLTPFESDRPRTPLITLRNANHVVTLPYLPARGDLYVEGGITEELDIAFYNFEALRPDTEVDMRRDFDSTLLTTLEEDIAAVLELYDALRGFDWAHDLGQFCKHAGAREDYCRARGAFDEAYVSQDTLEARLRTFVQDTRAALATDDWTAVDEVGFVTLAQWVAQDGSRIEARVLARFDFSLPSDVAPSERAFGLSLTLEYASPLRDTREILRRCHTALKPAGAVLPPVRRYTPEQAKIVYGGLLDAALEGLAAEGDTPAARSRALNDMPRAELDARREAACAALPDLLQKAGAAD